MDLPEYSFSIPKTRIEGSNEYTSLANAVTRAAASVAEREINICVDFPRFIAGSANSIWPMDALIIWARATGQTSIVTAVEAPVGEVS